uniref:Uncharacterized protein n=1 Tax=Anguilla anguilla TaxID=7936 RepID=A0A0E9SPZ2_ANGAN
MRIDFCTILPQFILYPKMHQICQTM